MTLPLKSNVVPILGDACALPLESSSVDLVVTHPPFFLVSPDRYGGAMSSQINFSRDKKTFIKLMVKAIREMERVLRQDGSIWISIGAADGVDYEVISAALNKTKLKIAGTFIHNYFEPEDTAEALRSDRVAVWVQLVKHADFYYNPFLCKRWSDPVWRMPFNNMLDPIDQELSAKFFMQDVVNKEIPNRLIQMYSKSTHTVLDPFGGSGIVAVTAAELGRKGVSVDISETQLKALQERIRLTLP